MHSRREKTEVAGAAGSGIDTAGSSDPDAFTVIGQRLERFEDAGLVQGQGSYTDDVSLPGQLFAAFARSAHGHGLIRNIDTAACLAMPGVVAAYTARDLAEAGHASFKCMFSFTNADGSPFFQPHRLALAQGKVRFVGDPVVCIVAETVAQAQDAAEAVLIDIDPLPAVTAPRAALEPDAPRLYDELPGNRALHYHFGDAGAVAKAFAAAAHVTRLRLINNRIVASPIEPRAVVACFDAETQRFTIYSPSQGVIGYRRQAARLMNMPESAFRIVSRNVGGSFGMKSPVYPEYVSVFHAARALGRPVRWTASRSEAFLADFHGRDHDTDAELALDADGNFLAVRLTVHANLGAFLTNVGPNIATVNAVKNVIGAYRTPLVEVTSYTAYTNTQPVTAYRGAGRPEGNYYMERLIDTAAAEMGIDRVELRRRNHIQPGQMPYRAPSDMTIDSGEFTAIMDKALEAANWAGFPQRRQQSTARGRLRGIGLGQFVETTAPIAGELGGIRFEEDGGLTLLTGTHDQGQGHWTAFAQVVAEKLGLDPQSMVLVQTDSDQLSAGNNTGGSKSLMASASAFVEAAAIVIYKAKRVASHLLEADIRDLDFTDGHVVVAGTDRRIHLLDIARHLRSVADLPPDLPDTLDVENVSRNYPWTFPNGCHICELEIEPATGHIEILRYVAVNDFGVIVNPMLVEGQMHGGIVQGIGQCLMEEVRYGDGGQPITGSFMDYAMPRAGGVPFFEIFSRPVPSPSNPLGVKGCGEAGCAGAMTSVMNAVADALSQRGIAHLDMPATPLRVWQALAGVRPSLA